MTRDSDALLEARSALNDIVEQTPIAPEWQDLAAGLQRLDRTRPPRRWRGVAVALLSAVAALAVIGAVSLLLSDPPPGNIASSPGTLITSESILEDGVVTEAEYHAGAEAVVSCLAEAGIEAELDFDDPNGHAGYYLPQKEGIPLQYQRETNRCLELHLSGNVSIGWGVTLGQVDLDDLRHTTTAIFACVEQTTGEDFGDVTYDGFGYITENGRQAHDAAFEFQDHQPWEECRSELGLEVSPVVDEYQQEATAGVALVERDGLALTIRGQLDSQCLEVRSDTGMSGGCGLDFNQPLSISTGGIDGQSFISGWAPENTARLVVTYADADEIEITGFAETEGIGRLFFLELIPPNATGEPSLPITAVAFDDSDHEVARFVLSEEENS